MKKKAMFSGLLAVLVLSTAAWAQEENEKAPAPGERGHVLKMTREMIRLGTAKDPDAKVDLFLGAGGERVKELDKMQRQGQTTHHEALGKSYDQHVNRGANGVIENGALRGKDMTGALGRYAEATAKHLQVLEALLARCPLQARKGLTRALEASRHGHEQAILAHERGKGKGKGPAKGKGKGKGRPGADDDDGVEGKGKPEDEAGGKDPGAPPDKGKPDDAGKPEDKGKPPDKGRPDDKVTPGGEGKGKSGEHGRGRGHGGG